MPKELVARGTAPVGPVGLHERVASPLFVAAWYAEQSRREKEVWLKMPASTAAQREARSKAMKEQQDHKRLADEQLVLASQAQAAVRAQSADEAYNQGAKAGADLRRAIQAIVDRRLSAVWDQVF